MSRSYSHAHSYRMRLPTQALPKSSYCSRGFFVKDNFRDALSVRIGSHSMAKAISCLLYGIYPPRILGILFIQKNVFMCVTNKMFKIGKIQSSPWLLKLIIVTKKKPETVKKWIQWLCSFVSLSWCILCVKNDRCNKQAVKVLSIFSKYDSMSFKH